MQWRGFRKGWAYVDELYSEKDYHGGRPLEMESLVVPVASTAEGAGRLTEDLRELWN